MVTEAELRERLDAVAEDYRADPDQSYEAGVMVALVCQRAVSSPSVGYPARLLRDAFGTWAHHIHSYGSGGSKQAALAGHASIERALDDWLAGGRSDLTAFAERWQLDERDVAVDWVLDGR